MQPVSIRVNREGRDMSTFTRQQVEHEVTGMIAPDTNRWIPSVLAKHIACLHDELEDFWTVMCAADAACARYYGNYVEPAE